MPFGAYFTTMNSFLSGWRGARSFIEEDLEKNRAYYEGVGAGASATLLVAAVVWFANAKLSLLPTLALAYVALMVAAKMVYRPWRPDVDAEEEPEQLAE